MKKQLPTDVIRNDLEQSVFFQKPLSEQAQRQDIQLEATPHVPLASVGHEHLHEAGNREENEISKEAVKPDVMTSDLTSQHPTVELKKWQEMIENTETQNSALRLTSEERYAVEDVVSELRRQYGIKTSMNEIGRLGLLLLVQDFKQHKQASLIYKVKKV